MAAVKRISGVLGNRRRTGTEREKIGSRNESAKMRSDSTERERNTPDAEGDRKEKLNPWTERARGACTPDQLG